MRDELLRVDKLNEVSWWTCPECDADCDVETYSEIEIREDADSGMEYEVTKVSIDKCTSCGYILEHDCFR